MKSLILISLFSTLLIAKDFFHKVEIDNEETIDNVVLKSGKKGDNRYYEGTLVKSFDRDIKSMKKAILAFNQRCNNEYKEKREFSDKKEDCKYHNGNVIENILHTDLKEYTKEKNEIERLLISRRIYNREEFSQTDLVRVYQFEKDKKNTIQIFMKMIKKKEAKKYIKPLVETNSAFNRNQGVFTLTEIAPNKTELAYTYNSRTDHWLINKSIAAGEVFENVSKSLNSLFKHLATEALSNMSTKHAQAQQGK